MSEPPTTVQPQPGGGQQGPPGYPPSGYGVAQPGMPMYGQPGQPGYGPPPGQPGYGPPPGHPGYGPPPGQPGYGPPPGQPGYGPPPGQPGYGPPMGQPGYGPPPGQASQWMTRPEAIPGCPPGLEYLTQVDQLLIQQQMELLEALTGWETANKYKIKNNLGQQVYFAAEESDACTRQCCGPQRGFTIHITDNMGQELIRVTREFKCCAGCSWCASVDACAHEITVEAPPGQVVGYVKQQQSSWAPYYHIMNANHEMVLSVKGPMCIVSGPCCRWDQEFLIFSKDDSTEVGKISKQWSGLLREYFTDADNFGVSFPMDLDVKMKAVMIGLVFLIDFMFFETQQQNQNRNQY
ncbi:hypothetical protein ScPMuIL_008704 [Solemya velum]